MPQISNYIWLICTLLIIYIGIYFTFQLNFIQLNFAQILKKIKKDKKNKSNVFDSLMIALASRIGVGSISGVALAIYLGGAGTIFWMWVSAFLGASITYVETFLGIKYRVKDDLNDYRSGPSYYIKNGLNKPTLAKIYSLILFLSYLVGFISLQSNTIIKSLNQIIKISSSKAGFIISLLTLFIIFGGIKNISKVTSKIVSLMITVYFFISLYILIINIHEIPLIFINIFKSAFKLTPFFSSFIPHIIIGIQKAIFSNEAGMGTSAVVSSVSNVDYKTTGFVQILGTYITTLICTFTAIIILTSPFQNLKFQNLNGIEITQFAFTYHLGFFGNIIIFILILLFAFSTILASYYEEEVAFNYLVNQKNKYNIIIKIITCVLVFVGCISSSFLIWNIIDLMIGIMTIINIYSIYKLRKEVKK